MKIIGITGGIGSGKSRVCNYLKEEHGAAVITADDVARQAVLPGTACHEKLRALLGEAYFLEDGTLNRAKTGEMAFASPEILEKMNAIIHPAVREMIVEGLKNAEAENKRLAVIEAALLVGSGYRELCSEYWYVYADTEARLERLAKGRDLSRERAIDVMKNQPSDEEFRRGCDRFIDNSGGFSDTKRQVDELLKALYAC